MFGIKQRRQKGRAICWLLRSGSDCLSIWSVAGGSLVLPAGQMCRQGAGMRTGIPKPAKNWEQGGDRAGLTTRVSRLGSEQLVHFTLLCFQSRGGRAARELGQELPSGGNAEAAGALQHPRLQGHGAALLIWAGQAPPGLRSCCHRGRAVLTPCSDRCSPGRGSGASQELQGC